MTKKDVIPFTKAEEKVIEKIVEERVMLQTRFPILITLLATFGFVSVLYGFEKMIDNFEFFAEKPLVLFLTGLAILAITGSLYKKLD